MATITTTTADSLYIYGALQRDMIDWARDHVTPELQAAINHDVAQDVENAYPWAAYIRASFLIA